MNLVMWLAVVLMTPVSDVDCSAVQMVVFHFESNRIVGVLFEISNQIELFLSQTDTLSPFETITDCSPREWRL